MQSQQKKVKWSRGETADALEERTDTGITQVSVSKMENIIADVYGNISRRPAFKVIQSDSTATEIPVIIGNTGSHTSFAFPPQSFVFTVDANTYIIFIRNSYMSVFGGMLIRNNKFVKRVKFTYLNDGLTLGSGQISAAQYNNFMIVSNLYTTDVILRLTSDNDITVEKFLFSAPWYAPYGTETKQVSNQEVSGLEFDAASVGNYTYTEANGTTTVYSWISTGVSSSTLSGVWTADTTSFYLHYNSSTKQYYINTTAAGKVSGPFTFTHGQTYTDRQSMGVGLVIQGVNWYMRAMIRVDSAFLGLEGIAPLGDISYGMTTNPPSLASIIPIGSIVQFPNNGAYMRVEGYDSDGTKLRMYGAFLTPIANDTAKDTRVKVETGYISLNNYIPKKFTFSDQRLYASGFYKRNADIETIPGYVVGSQIARYNDFKNDYNTQNEPISIDISTSYQEQVISMIDYNGLKILTDSAEYAFTNGAVVKQSENGSLADCNPLVVGSVCVYADKSGHQLRAMEYELKSNLFTSSSINQMAKEDLIYHTTSMATYLDKAHYSGRFLYAVQTKYNAVNPPVANHAMAVCNFVPGNQTMIWGRWTSPIVRPNSGQGQTDFAERNSIQNIVEVNNKVWFITGCYEIVNNYYYEAYTLTELDYENRLDIEVSAQNTDTQYIIIPSVFDKNYYAWVDQNDPDNVVYTTSEAPLQDDPVYTINGKNITQISTANNSPGGPNIVIDGVGYYEWDEGYYTKSAQPEPVGGNDDPSRAVYDSSGNVIANRWIVTYVEQYDRINVAQEILGIISVRTENRVPSSTSLEYTYNAIQYTSDYTSAKNIYKQEATMPNAVISVFDGDTYKWDDTVDNYGNLTQSLSELTDPRIGFKVNAVLESHPMDTQGKTYTEKKRIGKAVAVIRDTEPGAFTVCDKTGYTSVDKKTVNFYGCTGMKDLIRYTIKNIQGARFTIESLTMIVEYGTLDS